MGLAESRFHFPTSLGRARNLLPQIRQVGHPQPGLSDCCGLPGRGAERGAAQRADQRASAVGGGVRGAGAGS